MATLGNRNENRYPRLVSRRAFIKLAAMSGILAGCSPLEQLVTPTSPPAPTLTPAPTDTSLAATSTPSAPADVPTPTAGTTSGPVVVRRPDIIKVYPTAKSKVVQARHAGVWSGDALVPGALRQMLDASITALTGQNDARQAWAALFAPDERVAIKVNAFRNSIIWTQVLLVKAVTDSLQDAGIPAEQITVFDYYTTELKEAGFAVNQDGPGVRCYGTDDSYTAGFKVERSNRKLSDILLNSHALINMPVLKSHMISGLSFALKNHFGTVDYPDALHSVGQTIPALNALPEIKDRTRLVIGDMLTACLKYGYSYPYWKADYTGDSILMSFDPLAHDTVGLQTLKQLLTDQGDDPSSIESMAATWIENAGKAGLGANDEKNIELVELAVK
jgi:hypothetical protein